MHAAPKHYPKHTSFSTTQNASIREKRAKDSQQQNNDKNDKDNNKTNVEIVHRECRRGVFLFVHRQSSCCLQHHSVFYSAAYVHNKNMSSKKDTQQQHKQPQEQSSTSCASPAVVQHGYFHYLSSPTARHNLVTYQYKGRDDSLIYKYILSPLAQFCVDHLVPSWMAPNTITFIGLLGMVASYINYWFYVPSLDVRHPYNNNSNNDNNNNNSNSNNSNNDNSDYNDMQQKQSVPPFDESYPPRWIFLFNAIAMLVYQTLDNMDGKQARKTKSSSPLGLLFDHGCDAVNSIFGSVNWIITAGLSLQQPQLHPEEGNEWWLAYVLIFGPFLLFSVNNWEHYHTGEVILPIINGPNEGLVGGVMFSLLTFWYGPEFWQQTTWYETIIVQPFSLLGLSWMSITERYLRNGDIIFYLSGLGFVQEGIVKIISVLSGMSADKKKCETKMNTTGDRMNALLQLTPFAIFGMSFWVMIVMGTEQYFGNNRNAAASTTAKVKTSVWSSHLYCLGKLTVTMPRTTIHLATVLFIEQVTELMFRHITGQNFVWWVRLWPLLPLMYLLAVHPLVESGTMDGADMDMDMEGYFDSCLYILIAYTYAMAVYLMMKITLVIQECCAVLNIWCFDIVTPRPKP